MVAVKVYGLQQFRRAVGRLDASMPKVIDDASKEAAQLVAKAARRQVPIGPGINGHARNSVYALRQGDGWGVQGGGRKYPYYPWLDFGGTVRPYPNQEKRRPFFKSGRYIYPAYERNQPAVRRIMAAALERYAESSGLDVS